jgi:hypothetical protein
MQLMKKLAGLWIDHRKAVVVLINDKGEELREIVSGVEKHIRFSGGTASEDGSTEDVRDRQFGNHLNKFYTEVIEMIRDFHVIQIFGPGEAKGELERHLLNEGLKARILPIETVDKMTDRQIAAKVRAYIPA